MKIITEPRVRVVASTIFHGHDNYLIPNDGGNADGLCAFAAKGCYDSFGETGRSNQENQRQIISSRHGSVLEHFHISVFIEGITRALSLELNRHRGFAISQRSTRYTREEDSAIVLEPYYAELYATYIRNERGTLSMTDPQTQEYQLIAQHLHVCELAIEAYAEQVDSLIENAPFGMTETEARKWARGKARNLLPHALETRGTYTANLRTWRWFLELRSESHAEAEIRRLTNYVWNAIVPFAPTHFEDFQPYTHEDGLIEYVPTYTKI